ncbi:MAG: heparan-alpha-glucosaminide N-acetyltransferase domain-containing protein, partial [Saonia sp.]
MKAKTNRLYFIDAMRAWAILMMLQGHFVDGLLDNAFRDGGNLSYSVWQYFRGITAPVFFTVSGFIFTFLLIKVPQTGFDNPRVKKGIKRGLQLLFIGYLLRSNLFGLLSGEVYPSFYLVDVLHCIGLSILGIIGIYLLTHHKRKFVFPLTLVIITCLLFVFEPYYKGLAYTYLPQGIANYFTKANGSVFTIFPWFGYAAFGGFLSILFSSYKNFRYLYPS